MGFFDWFKEITHIVPNKNEENRIIQYPFYNDIDWNNPKQTMNASDDYVYQHLFICRKKN